jgi:hypothetical protein
VILTGVRALRPRQIRRHRVGVNGATVCRYLAIREGAGGGRLRGQIQSFKGVAIIAAWARRRRSGRAQLSVAPIPRCTRRSGGQQWCPYSNQKIARVENAKTLLGTQPSGVL